MTLEYQIFDEKASLFSGFSVAKTFSWRRAWRQPMNCPRFVRNRWRVSGTMAKPSLIRHSHGTSRDKRGTTKETVSEWQQWQPPCILRGNGLATKNQEKRRAYLSAFSSKILLSRVICVFLLWGLFRFDIYHGINCPLTTMNCHRIPRPPPPLHYRKGLTQPLWPGFIWNYDPAIGKMFFFLDRKKVMTSWHCYKIKLICL